MIAAEDVEWQVAVTILVAVEEASFLAAVDEIVGGVQVEHDAPWRPLVGLQKEIDEEVIDGCRVILDAMVAVRGRRRMLQSVERALARQRRQVWPPRLQPPQNGSENRSVAQVVVVDRDIA